MSAARMAASRRFIEESSSITGSPAIMDVGGRYGRHCDTPRPGTARPTRGPFWWCSLRRYEPIAMKGASASDSRAAARLSCTGTLAARYGHHLQAVVVVWAVRSRHRNRQWVTLIRDMEHQEL